MINKDILGYLFDFIANDLSTRDVFNIRLVCSQFKKTIMNVSSIRMDIGRLIESSRTLTNKEFISNLTSKGLSTRLLFLFKKLKRFEGYIPFEISDIVYFSYRRYINYSKPRCPNSQNISNLRSFLSRLDHSKVTLFLIAYSNNYMQELPSICSGIILPKVSMKLIPIMNDDKPFNIEPIFSITGKGLVKYHEHCCFSFLGFDAIRQRLISPDTRLSCCSNLLPIKGFVSSAYIGLSVHEISLLSMIPDFYLKITLDKPSYIYRGKAGDYWKECLEKCSRNNVVIRNIIFDFSVFKEFGSIANDSVYSFVEKVVVKSSTDILLLKNMFPKAQFISPPS
jgi:hypothetical protein